MKKVFNFWKKTIFKCRSKCKRNGEFEQNFFLFFFWERERERGERERESFVLYQYCFNNKVVTEIVLIFYYKYTDMD